MHDGGRDVTPGERHQHGITDLRIYLAHGKHPKEENQQMDQLELASVNYSPYLYARKRNRKLLAHESQTGGSTDRSLWQALHQQTIKEFHDKTRTSKSPGAGITNTKARDRKARSRTATIQQQCGTHHRWRGRRGCILGRPQSDVDTQRTLR